LYQCYVAYTDVSEGMHVTGTVVRSVQTDGSYHALVRFITSQGVMRFTDRFGAEQPEFQDGASVPVFFSQYEPEKARIYSWKRVWFVPVLLALSGLLPLLAGIGIVWLYERMKQLMLRGSRILASRSPCAPSISKAAGSNVWRAVCTSAVRDD